AMREPSQPTSVGVHDVDLRVAITRAAKGDRASVGRPGRLGVVCEAARQVPLPAPVGVHDVDTECLLWAGRYEGDRLSVGRPGGRAGPAVRQPPLVAPVDIDDVELPAAVGLS